MLQFQQRPTMTDGRREQDAKQGTDLGLQEEGSWLLI